MKKNIADILREIRIKNGKTQADIAQVLGLKANAVQAYEQGRSEPNLSGLCKLADFYGVTTDYLLGREPDSKSNELLVQYNSLEDKQKRLVKAYLSLSGEIRNELFDTIKDLILSAEKE